MRSRGFGVRRSLKSRSFSTIFAIEAGRVVRPALRAPLPETVPDEFLEADRHEQTRPDLALGAYRALEKTSSRPSLALLGIARCLEALKRRDDARKAWRTLAAEYPDERDLSHRPFGVVAAIAAGDTAGLYELIESGRWELSGDYASHFLHKLDPQRTSPYMKQFGFARELSERFQHQQAPSATPSSMRPRYGTHRIFYRSDRPDRIAGFSAESGWIDGTQAGNCEPARRGRLGPH